MQSNLSEILPKLQERFPIEHHRERKLPGGGDWYYVPWQFIRDRLNVVCPGQWSIDYEAPQFLDKYCYVKVSLTICGWTQHSIGNAPIELLSSSGKDMSRGNPIERAIADGFKNAAETFGIAAYLDEQADDKTKKDFAQWMRSNGNTKAAVQMANKAAGRPERSANAARIREKREAEGLSLEQVRKLMKDNFKTDEPSKLSIGQVEQLFKLMEALSETLKPQEEGQWDEETPVITTEQVKRFWAIARTTGYTDNGVKALLAINGIESSKQIPKHLYEDLCTDLESAQMAAWWNSKGEQPEAQAA
jgi:hypothetical protein